MPAGRTHRIRRRRGQLVGASRSVRHSGRDRRGGSGGARHSDEAGVQHSGRGPAGANRTLTIRAFDAGGVETHSGSVTLDIRPGTNPAVSVVLTPLAGNQPIDVTLGSFAVTVTPAAATLTVGDTISLGAAVLDANGQPVTGP